MARRICVCILLFCFVSFFNAGTATAQPLPCDLTGDPDDPGYDPNECPLDAWIYVMAAGGLYIGWRTLNSQRATKKAAAPSIT